MANNDRKRKVLPLDLRVEVVKMIDSGKSLRAIAQKFDCGRTQISNIKIEREAIMKEWESGGCSDLKYIKKRKTIYEDLNSEIWDWFCKAR